MFIFFYQVGLDCLTEWQLFCGCLMLLRWWKKSWKFGEEDEISQNSLQKRLTLFDDNHPGLLSINQLKYHLLFFEYLEIRTRWDISQSRFVKIAVWFVTAQGIGEQTSGCLKVWVAAALRICCMHEKPLVSWEASMIKQTFCNASYINGFVTSWCLNSGLV